MGVIRSRVLIALSALLLLVISSAALTRVARAEPAAFTGSTGSTGVTGTTIRPPRIVSASVADLRQDLPFILVTVSAGSGAPALKSITLTLPAGFSFTGSTHLLDHSIRVRGVRFSASSLQVQGRSLTETLITPLPSITLYIQSRVLQASPALVSSARADAHARAPLTVVTADATGHETHLTGSLKL